MNAEQIKCFNECRWKVWRELYVYDVFPAQGAYHESKWAIWEMRIKEAQRMENENIGKMIEKLNALREADVLPFDTSMTISDECWMENRITNAMYAALVVSIWADMEYSLKNLVRIYLYVAKKSERFPYNFGEIEKFFTNQMKIDLKLLPEYLQVNALRILNNSFKHDNGYYRSEPSKQYDHICPKLLHLWGIKNDVEIKYSELPVKDLVASSNLFSSSLFENIKSKLK